MAFPAAVTHSAYLYLMAIWRATYWQRNDLLLGSQVAASPFDFCSLASPSQPAALVDRWQITRCSYDNCAPFCQASDSATT